MGEIMQVFFIDQNVKNNFFKTLFKKIEYPSNWNEVIYKWKNNEITARKSMELLGLKQTTFYKLVRE